MTRRAKAATAVIVLGFVGFLAWGTFSSQKVQCSVVVRFRGQVDSATASAASADDAGRQAQSTACGTLAHGMDEKIACDNVVPVKRVCQPA